ncbi:MAG TPA: transcriptional regulator, partial [Candidatus Blautia faecigallinarum]|nr:transcriptional regulator [Candidatus Blautia faecigallinarum]
RYYEVSNKLEIAALEKDADTVLAVMKEMLASLDQIGNFRKASLYEHLDFKETSDEFLTELRENLLKCFRDEESFGFLKNDKRWQELIEQQ